MHFSDDQCVSRWCTLNQLLPCPCECKTLKASQYCSLLYKEEILEEPISLFISSFPLENQKSCSYQLTRVVCFFSVKLWFWFFFSV